MKLYQLKELSQDELLQKRFELQEELFNLRLTSLVKKLDNPLKLRNLRRDVARINTLLRIEERKPQQKSAEIQRQP
uniref:Large ribosomal subunit protein uL29 n=1 Tax=uncultured candidate division Zixibacteria bacterium Rifle_16ft_4_minimus_38126 TaxID=1665171 RepID=A0A0H4TS37_UNCZI|nr:50S ribosomal protein L29, large subunit ribosomal protein L29 [uncultured candidate division Zixibacteria bacterium Rifle_16ft_4_minimus_38126]